MTLRKAPDMNNVFFDSPDDQGGHENEPVPQLDRRTFMKAGVGTAAAAVGAGVMLVFGGCGCGYLWSTKEWVSRSVRLCGVVRGI